MTNKRPPYTASDWSAYHHAVVRDIAWILFSEPIFHAPIAHFRAFAMPLDSLAVYSWLAWLEKNPAHLAHLERKNFTRLGLYCEALLDFCFTAGWDADVIPFQRLAKNLQIINGKITAGECDFILRDRFNNVVHLELAVKFYLQDQPGMNQWNNWLGPNSIDRLDIKMQRLLSHQLPLLTLDKYHAATSNALDEMGITGPIEPCFLVKGCMFTNVNRGPTAGVPEFANTQLPRGFWFHYSEAKTYFKEQNVRAWLCKKLDWLTGPSMDKTPLFADEIVPAIDTLYLQAVAENRKPPPAYFFVGDKLNKLQPTRVIVVPDHWPGTNFP